MTIRNIKACNNNVEGPDYPDLSKLIVRNGNHVIIM